MPNVVSAFSNELQLSTLEKSLLNDYQQSLPMTATPFADMAEHYNITEKKVIDGLKHLQNIGAISRIGAVFKANSIGASTLAAMAIPQDKLQAIADIVSSYKEVNHNYEREHHYNLWFVVAADSRRRVNEVLQEISEITDYSVMNLPMKQDFHINLGFKLQWN